MTNEELKKTLWDAANKLRGSVSAAEYKYPVLGSCSSSTCRTCSMRRPTSSGTPGRPESEHYIEDKATRNDVAEAASLPTRPSTTRTTCSGCRPRPIRRC
jgi:type I restriction enzyme M protein